jgi:NADH/NAD ratio-sensing transcriptional regulator Rex
MAVREKSVVRMKSLILLLMTYPFEKSRLALVSTYVIKNDQVGQRTKHIDIKWHHVREMVQNGEIIIVFLDCRRSVCRR